MHFEVTVRYLKYYYALHYAVQGAPYSIVSMRSPSLLLLYFKWPYAVLILAGHRERTRCPRRQTSDKAKQRAKAKVQIKTTSVPCADVPLP